MKRKFWLPLLFAVIFIGGIWVGNSLNPIRRTKTVGEEKLLEVINLINTSYVDSVEIDSLVELTIPTLLKYLDPHSAYIPAEQLQAANVELDGKFSGIGISFQILNDTLSVIEVISGGPAEKVGVLPGDRILEVDGQDIASQKITEQDVFSLLRGEKGTHVKITVKRTNSAKPIEFEIVRDDIPVESVDAAYMIEPGVGYIKVSRFARNTYNEFLQALYKLRVEGAENYVIDLRYNTGGYMEPAVMMANEFLSAGDIIVSTRGANHKDDQIFQSDGIGAFQECGIAVLINEFTASASEIFSGAIQDNDRGWVIGRRSFGKGLVQHPVLLADSSEVRLTVQRYYTPSGRCIQKPYIPGDIVDYEAELANRFNNGESLSADSIKLHTEDQHLTVGGRSVYGGGGVMPDLFVPEDTSKITSYYINVSNQNLLTKFAYEYCDLNRPELQKGKTVEELVKLLPPDNVLLDSFVHYASINGVPARWFYINISTPLIVNQLKALIARNILGLSAYYEIINSTDKAVDEAAKHAPKPLTADS